MFVLVCSACNLFATLCSMTENRSRGHLWGLFSLHADPSCTMRLGGRLGKVWVSPDDPGRVYGCGKTDQNTKSIEGGHLWCTGKMKTLILFHFYSMNLVQCAWEGDWVKFGFVRMILVDPTAVARQLGTPISSKSCTWKTACLDLTNGPQHLSGRGKHVVRSDLAKPVPYTFHTYPSFHVFTWNLSPWNHEWFAHGLHMVHAWFARNLWSIASLAPER